MSTSDGGGKPIQAGLVDMGVISFYNDPANRTPTFDITDLAAYPGSFSEIVLNVTWAQLQPLESGPLITAAIDAVIPLVDAYNVTNGTELGIKLRVWGGYTAPEWAKAIGGEPITIVGQGSVDPNNYNDNTIGRFWTADYIDAWTSFQNALAERYDSNPLIRGISNTAGASATDEPFVPLKFSVPLTPTLPPPNPPPLMVNQVALLQAGGYTDAAQMLTLRASIADYAAWSTTPLDYTMNLFHQYDGGGDHGDANFTLAVLQQARNSTRLVQAGNHALSTDPLGGADAVVYAQMTADAALDPTSAPGSYQTQSPTKLGGYDNWVAAIEQGVLAHAGDIELWDFPAGTGFTGFNAQQVQALATIVAAGVAPTTGAPADSSALGFVAPAFATGAPGTIAFSGTDAVLLASASTQGTYSITLTSARGGTLAVTDVFGIASGPTSGHSITFAGSLAQVNTVLASLTDTLSEGTDIVRITATDGSGPTAIRDVGVQTSTTAGGGNGGTADPSLANQSFAFGSNTALVVGESQASDLALAGALGNSGILLVGGVQSELTIAGNLTVDGNTSLLAALAPNAYSTASLTVGGAFNVQGGGTAHFTGSLNANAISIDGSISGNGRLAASGGGPIVNHGTIEAAADQTLGMQRLVVANALTGNGTVMIDAGATLILSDAVDHQTIQFAANSIAQLANNPYSPSTLVLQAPQDWDSSSCSISGFSFADRLVLSGVAATGASYDSATGTLIVSEGAGSLSFALSGDVAGLIPDLSVTGSGATAQTTVRLVAPPGGLPPTIYTPATLEGSTTTSVLVPGVVVLAPLPAAPTLPSDLTLTATLVTTTGELSAVGGSVTSNGGGGGTTLTITGTLAEVEQSLQTLTYTAAAAVPDSITIEVSGFAGTSAPMTIAVSNGSAPSTFTWSGTNGSFADAANWSVGVTPPGGASIAEFQTGTHTVSGDGAVGQILVKATTTLTGQVTAQGHNNVSLLVDSAGALTLAGGAVLNARQQATVDGLLLVMGGALALAGPSSSNALVIGAASGSDGTVLNLEQITATGNVVVGGAGTGTLELLGVASSLYGGGNAEIGDAPGSQGTAIVNGGYWQIGQATGNNVSSGQLTVGDAGSGALLIDGAANGIAGQVTAFAATIGNLAGSQGSVTLDGGLLLVANAANAAAGSSALTVGASGTGSLVIEDGSEVAVGAAVASNNGSLVVGEADGGRGLIRVGSYSSLLVYGDAFVGDGGVGEVIVGAGTDHDALFATNGTLAVGATGQVTLGGADAVLRADTFEIASGGLVSGWGTLSGLLGGNNTVQLASIDNDGSIVANGGDLLLYGSVTGAGELSIGTNATLTFQTAVESGQTLVFGSSSNAALNDPRAFKGTIMDFGPDDVLKLASTAATSATWSDGVLTVQGDFNPIQLKVAGNYAPDGFTVQSDGLGGTNVVGGLAGTNAGGYGDVHMITFAGLSYDFQAVGEFVAVRSTGPGTPWQIQIETKGIHGVASFTTALAATLGDDWVTFAVGRGGVVHVDGTADTTLHIGAVQNLAGGTLAQLSDNTWQLTWNAGQSVTVTDHGDWLDWAVGLGPHDGAGSVQGLLGSNNGQATDFQLPDGTVLPQPLSNEDIVGFYADAWRVPHGASQWDL